MAEVFVYAPFGVDVPFAEPAWYQGAATPYFRQTHVEYRARLRQFVEREIMPFAGTWDEEGTVPPELYIKLQKEDLLVAWPEAYGGPKENRDYFHALIFNDELSRCGTLGTVVSMIGAMSIGLGPVVKFAGQELKDRVVRDIIEGRKRICLGITEPWGGSDVANIQTTARREGDFYVVSGQKKFISGGGYADYCTAAVRTGGEGFGGISLLLIPLKQQGVTIRRIETQV